MVAAQVRTAISAARPDILRDEDVAGNSEQKGAINNGGLSSPAIGGSPKGQPAVLIRTRGWTG